MNFGNFSVQFGQMFYLDKEAIEVGSHAVGAAVTSIVNVDLGVRALDDRIFVSTWFKGTKGATAGGLESFVGLHAGTAIVRAFSDVFLTNWREVLAAGAGVRWHQVAIFRVTTPGTLSVGLALYSEGSNFTTVAGSGHISAFVARGR
ncbi:MAG: hypothetical protein A2V70_19470 [Planctomycetes bacterium RBG_13_63_9]|nr:MAG: hypothetical protein A2V70_19470 [Planctomycetes bacterium RBG_13_63_9]